MYVSVRHVCVRACECEESNRRHDLVSRTRAFPSSVWAPHGCFSLKNSSLKSLVFLPVAFFVIVVKYTGHKICLFPIKARNPAALCTFTAGARLPSPCARIRAPGPAGRGHL